MTGPPHKLVVFSDLDGTLLDRNTYSYAPAMPALELLRQRRIPIVFCSSKTRAEQETYRRELSIDDPFIVENGGAIFVAKGYFSFSFEHHKVTDKYSVIELGIPYQEVRAVLERIRSKLGFSFIGFGDMSPEEVSRETGLDLEAARRAKKREYDETLKLEGSPEEVERVLKAIREAGLNYAPGGRYYDVMGPNDKGKAAKILIELYRKKLGQVETIGIGDSLNDLPMLFVVDIPFLVQRADGSWENIDLPRLHKVQGKGPVGWAKTIKEVSWHHRV
jgi:mannosyl-3-phosphoglycerate phosphatase